jgi:hypothetical protein
LISPSTLLCPAATKGRHSMIRMRFAPNQAPVAGGARSCALIGHGVLGYSPVFSALPTSWNQDQTTKRFPRRLESSTT